MKRASSSETTGMKVAFGAVHHGTTPTPPFHQVLAVHEVPAQHIVVVGQRAAGTEAGHHGALVRVDAGDGEAGGGEEEEAEHTGDIGARLIQLPGGGEKYRTISAQLEVGMQKR